MLESTGAEFNEQMEQRIAADLRANTAGTADETRRLLRKQDHRDALAEAEKQGAPSPEPAAAPVATANDQRARDAAKEALVWNLYQNGDFDALKHELIDFDDNFCEDMRMKMQEDGDVHQRGASEHSRSVLRTVNACLDHDLAQRALEVLKERLSDPSLSDHRNEFEWLSTDILRRWFSSASEGDSFPEGAESKGSNLSSNSNLSSLSADTDTEPMADAETSLFSWVGRLLTQNKVPAAFQALDEMSASLAANELEHAIATELGQMRAQAHANWGDISLEMGRLDEALAQFDLAVAEYGLLGDAVLENGVVATSMMRSIREFTDSLREQLEPQYRKMGLKLAALPGDVSQLMLTALCLAVRGTAGCEELLGSARLKLMESTEDADDAASDEQKSLLEQCALVVEEESAVCLAEKHNDRHMEQHAKPTNSSVAAVLRVLAVVHGDKAAAMRIRVEAVVRKEEERRLGIEAGSFQLFSDGKFEDLR